MIKIGDRVMDIFNNFGTIVNMDDRENGFKEVLVEWDKRVWTNGFIKRTWEYSSSLTKPLNEEKE